MQWLCLTDPNVDPTVAPWQPSGTAHNYFYDDQMHFYDDQMLMLPDGRVALVDCEEPGPALRCWMSATSSSSCCGRPASDEAVTPRRTRRTTTRSAPLHSTVSIGVNEPWCCARPSAC